VAAKKSSAQMVQRKCLIVFDLSFKAIPPYQCSAE
jgi:hypothetical protein